MALSLQGTLAAVLVLVSLASAFEPTARFANKTHHSPSLVHWNSSIDLIDTKQATLSHVFVYPLSSAHLSLQVTRRFHTLSFKLKSPASDTVCNVTLEGLFTARSTLKEKCSVASLSAYNEDSPFIRLDVSTSWQHQGGFAIWDIVADETVHIPIYQLSIPSYRRSEETPLETFILANPKANANASVTFSLLLDPDLPDGHDHCLSVSSSMDGAQIDVYYALEGWAQSNRSIRVQQRKGRFCLRNELFTQALGRVQVTFIVTNLAKLVSKLTGKIPSSIHFTVVPSRPDDFLLGHVLNPEKFEEKERPYGAWLFYHPEVFHYNVTSNSSKPVQICDMMANCYQMEEVVNGTMAKDGSKQYIVPEKVHRLLKYTPVVRLLTEDPKAKLETQYFSGQEETISRVLSHFTLEGNSPKLVQGVYHELRLRYATNANTSKPQSSLAPSILSLPMHLIDQRVQQFSVTLSSTESDLYLESIRLQFGSGSSLNHTYLNLSVPIGNSQNFSTQDFFKPKAHALPSAGTQLTGLEIAYRAIGGKGVTEGSEVEVGVAIGVSNIDHRYGADYTDYRPDVRFENFDLHYSPDSNDAQQSLTLTAGSPSALLLSNWIPANPVPDTDSWLYKQGHIRVAYRSVAGHVKLHQGDLIVKQIIWGLAEGEYVEEKELAHQEDAGNYFYEEIRMKRKLLNDRYRIGYLISLKEGVQGGAAGIRVDFEPNFEEITNALPSSPFCSGPTYGDVICRVEPYTCPEHYFKVNQDTGACQMIVPSL